CQVKASLILLFAFASLGGCAGGGGTAKPKWICPESQAPVVAKTWEACRDSRENSWLSSVSYQAQWSEHCLEMARSIYCRTEMEVTK
ncbi:MAG: hypothetical protein WC824_12000, partial [Bacteroidota bacterium]